MAEYTTATTRRGQGTQDPHTGRSTSSPGGPRQGDGVTSRPEHAEGPVARTIEEETAKLPSDLFLWAAGASIGGSLLLHCSGRKEASLFVGLWAPTFLMLGVYNKIVKVLGSDPRPAS